MPDQFALLVARFVTPLVRIADQPRGVQHQDHALRGVQNLLIEVPFPLQLRLKRLLLRHVQHQAPNLRNPPARVPHRRDVLQRVQQRPVLPPQRLFVVPQHPALRQRLQKSLPHFRRRIKVRAHIRAQQFLPRTITQHPHHRVIHVKKSSIRRREK